MAEHEDSPGGSDKFEPVANPRAFLFTKNNGEVSGRHILHGSEDDMPPTEDVPPSDVPASASVSGGAPGDTLPVARWGGGARRPADTELLRSKEHDVIPPPEEVEGCEPVPGARRPAELEALLREVVKGLEEADPATAIAVEGKPKPTGPQR